MAYGGRLLVLDFQLRHGGVPVEWRLGSHLLCGILLHGSCVTLLLPALVREYTSRFTTPRTPQDGSVAADDDAHRCLLIQGGGNHAFPGAGAGVEHGGHNSAWWLLCLLPAPGRNQGIMRMMACGKLKINSGSFCDRRRGVLLHSVLRSQPLVSTREKKKKKKFKEKHMCPTFSAPEAPAVALQEATQLNGRPLACWCSYVTSCWFAFETKKKRSSK